MQHQGLPNTLIILAVILWFIYMPVAHGEHSIASDTHAAAPVPPGIAVPEEQVARYTALVARYLNTNPLDSTQTPTVYMVSKNQLIKLTCPENPAHCASKVAIFDKRYFHILLDQNLQAKKAEVFASFIVHELTHAYQYFREPYHSSNPCNLALQNEREAYMMQNRFLSDKGLHYNFGQELRGALCPPINTTD